MHTFFLNPNNRSKRWAVNCRKTDLIKRDPESLCNLKICADHFEEEMFLNKKRLKSEAYPTLFNIPNPPPRVDTKRKLLVREEPQERRSKKKKANMI